jgi:hypothetical protein
MGDASSGGPGIGAVDCRRLGMGSRGTILFVHARTFWVRMGNGAFASFNKSYLCRTTLHTSIHRKMIFGRLEWIYYQRIDSYAFICCSHYQGFFQ